MKGSLVRILAVGLLVSAAACRSDSVAPAGQPLASSQVFTGQATIRYVNLEGGCWALETVQGSYEPVGLPAEFRKDGLRVYVVARGAPDVVGICMIAPFVRLDTIRLR